MYTTYNNSTIAIVQQITTHKAVLITHSPIWDQKITVLNKRMKPTMSIQTEQE